MCPTRRSAASTAARPTAFGRQPDAPAAEELLLEHLRHAARRPRPSNRTRAPGFSFWPGCISASHSTTPSRPAAGSDSSRHSTAPPLGTRRPSRRAANTRVSLTTSRSPRRRKRPRSAMRACSTSPDRTMQHQQARRLRAAPPAARSARREDRSRSRQRARGQSPTSVSVARDAVTRSTRLDDLAASTQQSRDDRIRT